VLQNLSEPLGWVKHFLFCSLGQVRWLEPQRENEIDS
jgi:hypothetical protein